MPYSWTVRFALHSFDVSAPQFWNMLPGHLKAIATNHELFRSGLKISLFVHSYLQQVPQRENKNKCICCLQSSRIPSVNKLLTLAQQLLPKCNLYVSAQSIILKLHYSTWQDKNGNNKYYAVVQNLTITCNLNN